MSPENFLAWAEVLVLPQSHCQATVDEMQNLNWNICVSAAAEGRKEDGSEFLIERFWSPLKRKRSKYNSKLIKSY